MAETTTQKQLAEQLARLSERITVMEGLVNRSIAVSEANNRALQGSNGGTGLLAEVAALQKAIEEHSAQETRCPIGDVLVAIYGDRKQPDAVPGLARQVADLRDWQKSMKYWYILFAGTVVTGLINIGLMLLFGK